MINLFGVTYHALPSSKVRLDSSFRWSDEGSLRFDDNDGNIMPTKEQFQKHKQAANREYIKKNYQQVIAQCNLAIACKPVLNTDELKGALGEVYYLKSRVLFQLSEAAAARDEGMIALDLLMNYKGTHDPITQEAVAHFAKIAGKLKVVAKFKKMLNDTGQRPDFETYYRNICDDPNKIMPLTEFPYYTDHCFTMTRAVSVFDDESENNLMHTLVNFSQTIGHINARQFLTEHVLCPGARSSKDKAFNLKPAQVISLIKATHYMMFNTLSVANREGMPGGVYTPIAVQVPRETGIPGKWYSQDFGCDENIRLLKQNGATKKDITQLKTFLTKFETVFAKVREKIIAMGKTEGVTEEEIQRATMTADYGWLIKQHSLDKLPGHRIFKRLIDHGLYPPLIPEAMNQFANELVEKLKHESDPFEIASFVILELSRILPFTIGNGRIMRLWAGAVLMLHGMPPPNYPNPHDYYVAFENCYHGEDDLALCLKKWSSGMHNDKQLKEICDYSSCVYIVNGHLVGLKKDAFVLIDCDQLCDVQYFADLSNSYLKKISKLTENDKNNLQQIQASRSIAQYSQAQLISSQMIASVLGLPSPNHHQMALVNLVAGSEISCAYPIQRYYFFRFAYDYYKYLPDDECYESAKHNFLIFEYMRDILVDHNYPEVCQTLMDKYQTTNLNVALRRASGKGDLEDLKILSQYVYSVDVRDDTDYGHTALFQACFYNMTDCANYLLSHGANPDIKDKVTGKTPRFYDKTHHVNWPGETKGKPDILTIPIGPKAE